MEKKMTCWQGYRMLIKRHAMVVNELYKRGDGKAKKASMRAHLSLVRATAINAFNKCDIVKCKGCVLPFVMNGHINRYLVGVTK